MSAASATPNLTILPERAFTLHCQGLRSPDIAQQLGVPQRTVRYWIAKIRDEIAAAEAAHLREEFLRAVEHLHQIAAAAWQAYEAEQTQSYAAAPHASANHTPAVGASAGRPLDPPTAPTTSGTAFPRHSPRYLRLALDAQRQISRLLGLNDHPNLLVPPTALASETAFPAESAITAALAAAPQPAIPAKTAMAVTAATPDLAILAESATHPALPLRASPRSPRPPCPPCAPGFNPRIPAKTATDTARTAPATPAFPASIPLHWRM